MTVVSPHHVTADGVVIGTYATMVEIGRGLDTLPSMRGQPAAAADRHGTLDDGMGDYDEKIVSLAIAVSPFDADGNESAFGIQDQLRANTDSLHAVFGKRGLIDLRRFVPDGAGGLLELQASAVRRREVVVEVDDVKWVYGVDLALPWPFWLELPLISRTSNTAHVINVGGTAPVAGMVLTFAGDGTYTDDTGAEVIIAGSSGPVTVDVRKKEVYQAGVLAMGLFDLGGGSDGHWVEWPAKTTVTVTATVGVAIDYHTARH